MRYRVLTVFVAVLALAALAQAQTFTDLFSFDYSDGGYPYTGHLLFKGGTLYGTTADGGSSYCGTIFSVTTAGVQTTLYNFTCGSDGAYPYGGVIGDSSGNLYGTADYDGSDYFGTVWQLTSSGTLNVLHTFAGGTSDLGYPDQGLAKDKNGNMYGTATYGGANSYGGIFEITSSGTFSILTSFDYSSTGAYGDYGALRIDTKGNLYGVLADGGTYGYGTLYEYSKGTFTVLHNFAGPTGDGGYPYGTVARDGKGNLYGTTEYGGTNDYYGTIWEYSSSGTYTILHNGNYSDTDCAYYGGGVSFGPKTGNLIGLAELGGSNYDGCLYELSSNGTLTILHSFDYSDGGYPFGDEVLLGPTGVLYGATDEGGSYYDGVVWSYAP